MPDPDPSDADALREELAEARAELERIYADRLPERVSRFGPMHGEPIERLQVTTATDGDVLTVAEQQGRLWLEVMRIRGARGGPRLASLYLTPYEAGILRDLLGEFLEQAR